MDAPYRRLVFVMIDGAAYDPLRELLEAGDLPAMCALAEAGGGLRKAITCFPSTTGPAYIPYLMGLFPGTANVPGYRWLSRAGYGGRGSRWTRPGVASYSGIEGSSFDADLPDRPTWFDYFPASRNVMNLISKGCHSEDRTRWLKPAAYVIGHYLDRWDIADRIAADAFRAAAREAPEFIACAFNGVDGHSHAAHPRAPKVIESYRTIDRALGDVVRIFTENGVAEETLWVIGSDHGQSPTHTHIDMARELDRAGYPALHHPRLWRRDARCAEMVSGNGMTQLYLRGAGARARAGEWGEAVPWEDVAASGLPDALLTIDGVDFVAGRGDDDRIFLRTSSGEGTITWRAGLCEYEHRGADPLGTGCFIAQGSDAVLSLTVDGPRPDAALQLEQIFRAERAGDLMVSAKEGYDLRGRWEVPEHRSTHGALIPPQMQVPLILSHPVAPGPLRTVDVFPTALRLLGKEPPPGIDGVSRVLVES